jgi:hypothetical protein
MAADMASRDGVSRNSAARGNRARAYAPESATEAVDMLLASLDYLAGAEWRLLGGRVQRSALRGLGTAHSMWTAAHASALLALDADGAYADEGHPSAHAWLRHQGKMTKRAASDLSTSADRQLQHPLLATALREGWLSDSWARQLARWTTRLPEGEVMRADKILLDGVRAGLPLYPDIARLAEAIHQAIRGQEPDPDDDPDDGFADRDVTLRTTIGGAGRMTGDLSATCAALLGQVFETFGKSGGSGDFRTPGERNHDALEQALRLSLGHPDIPQSGGMKTRAMAVMSLADLLSLDGSSALCEAWLSARAGQPGWFFGPAAQAAACNGQVSPVVTGTPDWDVLSDMADVFLAAHGIVSHRDREGGDYGHATSQQPDASPGRGEQPARPCSCTCGRCDCLPLPGPRGPLSPAARVALERTLLAMAIRALSGPSGLAGFLRTSLLGRPFNGTSLILDAGDTDDIPDHIRRAVILRDKHCQWPGGCDQPASRCEPHHVRPRHEGGETSLENLRLYCHAHHHVFIHRLSWKITHHPDGSRDATSPSGWTIRSHAPPVPLSELNRPDLAASRCRYALSDDVGAPGTS